MFVRKHTAPSLAAMLTAAVVGAGLWAAGNGPPARASAGADAGGGKPEERLDVEDAGEQEGRMFPGGLDHDFGARRRGAMLRHSFPVVNTGKADLTIVSVRCGAGCVTATAGKHVLRPGERGEITVSMDTRRFVGPKTVRVYAVMESGGVRKEVNLSARANSLRRP